MAILLSNTVWEGLSTESKPTYGEGARDGHFYKELDTGESYIRVNGEFTYINLGLSFIKATKSGIVTTDAYGQYHVEFSTPFIDDSYSVVLSCGDQDWGAYFGAIAYTYDLTDGGFYIQTRNIRAGGALGGVVVSWLATRDYDP